MATYTNSQVADLFGLTRRGLEKWFQRRARQGIAVPGRVGGKLSDESIAWIREQRASRAANGQPIARRDADLDAFLAGDGGQREYITPTASKPAQSAHVAAVVTGVTAESRIPDDEELWDRAIAIEKRGIAKSDLRYDQRVDIPDSRPVLVVVAGDIHLGNSYCLYSRALSDAKLVRDTPGAYLMVLGDLVDHWVSLDPKILGIQRESPMPHSDELALLESWVAMVREKLLAVVAGNHDLRSYRIAGVDILQHALGNAKVLYDHAEVCFLLTLGEASWRIKLRHSWPGRSQMNETYALEKDSKFNDGSWQIGVGGHWHPSTVCRPFIDKAHDNQRKMAIQLGSYQYDSAFARQCGMAPSDVGGSAGIMMWPDGKYQPFEDLEIATRFLAMERAR